MRLGIILPVLVFVVLGALFGALNAQTISLDPAYIAPLIAFLGSDASADITGRFIYASGGDVCFYPRPLQMAGTYFVRKDGKWTVDELATAIPASKSFIIDVIR